MAENYGYKRVYGYGLFCTGLLCFASPMVAKVNAWAFMLLRVFQGIFEGVTYPALFAMTARWIPLKERNLFIARSFSGSVFGLIITYPMCGMLIVSHGWESAFYVIGAITTVWFIFWQFLVFDKPDQHPRIAQEELDYIQNELHDTLNEKPKPIPWKSILMSVPFWGMVISDCGSCWGMITLGSNGPTYLKYMLGVDIKTNGLLSGLPYLVRYIGGLFHGAIADFFVSHGILSVLSVRRIFNSICMCGPAISMFILAFPPYGTECNVALTIAIICIGFFFNGGMAAGHFSSPVDLTPNYAGSLFGITNTISGGVLGFGVPVLIGMISTEMTFSSWTIIFGLASVIYVVTNVFYFFMISGEIQKWNFTETVSY